MNDPQNKEIQPSAPILFRRTPKIDQMRDPLFADWNRSLIKNLSAHELAELIDFSQMTTVFENFLEVVGLPVAIIDFDGRVLASSNWQRLCMEFHRINKNTLVRCLESDTRLSREMLEGKPYAIYRCLNGLTDCASPIIIEGKHIANLFIGQFFLQPPDMDYFRRQQEEFSFDKDAYFKALAEVPIVAEEKLPAILNLLTGLAHQIAQQSLAEKRALAAYDSVEQQVVERTQELSVSHEQLKKASAQLQELNATLDHRVQEEVGKNLEQERLLIQQSRLAAMGEMIGNIAHQWRQPLNTLGLLLANIRDAYEFNELNQEFLNKAVDDGLRTLEKMSTTIDDFRNFFKPNKAKENFGLGKAVESTLSLITSSLHNHGIAVSVEKDQGIQAQGFPNEFSQVLLNILNNAKDAILERKIGGGEIQVLTGSDQGKAWVLIKDNAGGIPDDILPMIFEPYFTTKEKGTGIGLYMSKMIMDHMGGTIVAGNVGEGAEFRLTLPST
ncbi:MAG: PocR ligand-binding domain-containing protein [Sulfuricella sp.]|nr:PocR ligand-binding domain-containing protein [Sulfuricella sp.]